MSTDTTNPKIRWLIRFLLGAAILSLVAEFLIHRHAEFGFSSIPGFYALAGFGAYCFIVLSAKSLRPLLRRDEDYYGDNGHD